MFSPKTPFVIIRIDFCRILFIYLRRANARAFDLVARRRRLPGAISLCLRPIFRYLIVARPSRLSRPYAAAEVTTRRDPYAREVAARPVRAEVGRPLRLFRNWPISRRRARASRR